MAKKEASQAQGKRVPLTEAEVDALCALPDAEFAAQRREAFPEEHEPIEREIEETLVSEQIAQDRDREKNGGWLGESYSVQLTPEDIAEGNRLIDEAIEADRRAAEG